MSEYIKKSDVISTIKSEFGFIPMELELKIKSLPTINPEGVLEEMLEKLDQSMLMIGSRHMKIGASKISNP